MGMSPAEERRLRDESRRAMRQANRFREIIELLSVRERCLTRALQAAAGATGASGAAEAFEGAAPADRASELPPRLDARAAAWPRVASRLPVFPARLQPLAPTPGWVSFSRHRAPLRIGFLVGGMSAAEVEEAVAEVEMRQVRQRDFIPVFITDGTDMLPFLSRGYVAEAVPSPAARRRSGGPDTSRYWRARIELIRSKWALDDVVDLVNQRTKTRPGQRRS